MLLSKKHAAIYYNTESEGETVYCYLTEEQLKTIYKRFGYPLAGRFAAVLKKAEHEFKRDLLYNIQNVGLVERYHVLVRRAFKIVTKELPKASREDRLQMAIKAINDTARPNSLVLTLFVFNTLLRLTEQDRPAAIPTVPDEEEDDSYVLFTKDSEVLIIDKERRDYKLLAKLRAERIIKSPGALFQESKAKELAGLIA
ncbi:hypothetical protein MBM_04537 [Drepanopeziza brunnea f. sp. 'multigermtubi' MB_m1]|uniref:Uncharacterized protein n=1 Tax=Marssonina brunnea f. sp. multigermtubi (strain MB_m1) TaxID=1072389 RepID=K1WH85_MARBU|nr:uncharacterized protein MBM_04537 [Drepanopeziza brunnea f. sp. 'multigermtubi' MB_m1]EKD16960.1 hypothetical protein MBM_04537 [Drepanopeziza brunnea f. sp. 'multigermtubi' MB_m1]